MIRTKNTAYLRLQIVIYILLGIVVFLVGAIVIDLYLLEGKAYPGVKVGGVAVGGLTESEIEKKLEMKFIPYLNAPLQLNAADGQWTIIPKKAGISIDWEATARKAVRAGKEKNLWEKFMMRQSFARHGKDISFSFIYQQSTLDDFFSPIAKSVDRQSRNAFFSINGDIATIIPEEEGYKLNRKRSIKNIENFFNQGAQGKSISLQIDIIKPRFKKAMLKKMNIRDKIVDFSTVFDLSNTSRANNIRMAVAAINGTILAPGEIFSFNKVVGPRVGEKGYREAPVIINNKLVPGLGGGVCQVSSTLYNVALLSNMEIVERRNHSLNVGYVPLGRDATVAYGLQDLKFRNNTGGYFLISGRVIGNSINFAFYGKKVPGQEVTLYSDNIKLIPSPVQYKDDSNLPVGTQKVEKGKNGYMVTLWRIVRINGQIVSRQIISQDRYNPTKTTIWQGAAPSE